MTNEELKKQIIGILLPIIKSDKISCNEENACERCWFPCEINRETDKLADALIAAGLIFKKDYRKSLSAELARQERFAEEQGFTPDCSPYYIALQYKQRLSEAEYWKSVYDLALNIAFTREERAYFCKKAEEELNKEESGEKKEI